MPLPDRDRRRTWVPWPTGLVGTVLLTAVVATHLPLLALVGYLVVGDGAVSSGAMLLVTLLATGVATALALGTLHRLLRVLSRADQALTAYREQGVVLPLPPGDPHAARSFIQNVAQTVQTFHAQRRHLEQLAAHDPLTGLLNRRAAEERLQRMAAVVQDAERPVCLAVVDVDHFKALNDQFGHLRGDAVLVALGQCLAAGVRRTDWVARLGGDEFLIVLEAPLAEACRVLEELRIAVGALVVGSAAEGGGAAVGGCTVSIGLACLARAEDPLRCLQRADRALYDAKAAGRNRLVVAPPPGTRGAGPHHAVRRG